jgi:hypothetical protein
MEVLVVFRYPDISDPGGADATWAIDSLTESLKGAGVDCDSWHIEEAFSDACTEWSEEEDE